MAICSFVQTAAAMAVLGSLALVGCSSDDDLAGPGVDASVPSADAALGAANDAAVDVDAAGDDAAASADAGAVPDAGCATTIEQEITEAGAFTDSCVTCYEMSCADSFAACDQNCKCPAAVEQALQCVALGGTQESCIDVVLPILGANAVLQLYQCASLCKSACHHDAGAGDNGDAGNDGGTADDAGADAATDAAADAGDAGGGH